MPWSCGTSTAASVPCMFSHLGREGFDEPPPGLRNAAGRAAACRPGRAVDRQPVRLQGRVRSRAPRRYLRPEPSRGCVRAANACDEIMLEGLDQRHRGAARGARRARRGAGDAPDGQPRAGLLPALADRRCKRFLPECTSANLQDCSRRGVAQRLRQLDCLHRSFPGVHDRLAEAAAGLRHRDALRRRPRRIAGREQPLPARDAVRHRARGAKARALDYLALARLRAAQRNRQRVPARQARRCRCHTTTTSIPCWD